MFQLAGMGPRIGCRRHASIVARHEPHTAGHPLILPHPGDEAEWFTKNADALDGIQGTGL